MEAVAKLNKFRISPRKARLVVDLIRGKHVQNALQTLKYDTRRISGPISKLLLSSISNWRNKNKEENKDLYITEIRVDSAGMLKRIKPAPQGRGHKIRKRSSHITIKVDVIQELKDKAIKQENISKHKTQILDKNNSTSQKQSDSTKSIRSQEKKQSSIISKNDGNSKDIKLNEQKEEKHTKKESISESDNSLNTAEIDKQKQQESSDIDIKKDIDEKNE